MELVFSARDHQYIIFWIFNREVPDKVSCRVEISQQLRKQLVSDRRHAADAFLLLHVVAQSFVGGNRENFVFFVHFVLLRKLPAIAFF